MTGSRQCVFRVDASKSIGTGHVMRCLTLAHTLVQNGYEVSFISRNHQGNIHTEISRHGFRLLPLPPCPDHKAEDELQPAHAAWLECSQQLDSRMSIQAIASLPEPDWLIVDHYALDQHWQQAMRPHCRHIMVIDDLADRQHDADILLDQNLYPDASQRYHGRVPQHCKLLIGPDYTLLRDEFIQVNTPPLQPRTEVQTVLVFFGGVDASDETGKTLRAIQRIDADFTTHVVIGASNPHRDALEQLCRSMHNVHCHFNISNMAQLMAKADLAIGGGGTTTWERCYLGLPAITLTLAENQSAVNRAVAQHGACLLAGDTSTSEQQLATLLQQLVEHPGQLADMSRAAFSIMQNHVGAQGVVEYMQQYDA